MQVSGILRCDMYGEDEVMVWGLGCDWALVS